MCNTRTHDTLHPRQSAELLHVLVKGLLTVVCGQGMMRHEGQASVQSVVKTS